MERTKFKELEKFDNCYFVIEGVKYKAVATDIQQFKHSKGIDFIIPKSETGTEIKLYYSFLFTELEEKEVKDVELFTSKLDNVPTRNVYEGCGIFLNEKDADEYILWSKCNTLFAKNIKNFQGFGEEVIILAEGDEWLSSDSTTYMGIFTNKQSLIEGVIELVEQRMQIIYWNTDIDRSDYDLEGLDENQINDYLCEELKNDIICDLLTNFQTQGYHVNFQLIRVKPNKVGEIY